MFNQTVFPMLPFYVFQQSNNKLFKSKIINLLTPSNLLQNSYHKLLDSRETLLNNIIQIIINFYFIHGVNLR